MVFKDILTVYGNGKPSREETQNYIADSHSALVMSIPEFSSVFSRYSMHRVLSEEKFRDLVPYAYDADMLIVSPHQAPSLEAWMAGMSLPEYLERVKPDEEYMWKAYVGGNTSAFDVHPAEIFGASAGLTTGAFDFLYKAPHLDEGEFAELLAKASQSLADESGYREVVGRRIDNLPAQTTSMYAPARVQQPDAIVESWIREVSRLAEVRDLVREAYSPFVDASRSCSVVTSETVIAG